MLVRLARRFLRPYARPLIAVVLLQLVATIMSLYLPSLNGDIIDLGIARGDTGFIVRTGGWMLVVTLVQVAASVAAVYYASRTSMALGRDLRGAIFHRVGEFSAREVNQFGAPSLITRNTNDVQQIQTLVQLMLTMLVAAPITMVGGVFMALREDVGLSWLMVVSVPTLALVIGLLASRMVPLFRKMQGRIDVLNRVLREQITGVRVVRAFVREDVERERFRRANADLTDTALRVGRLLALMFPIVMLVFNVSSVAVLWFGAQRVDAGAMEIGSLTAFLQYLVQILMSVMMATFVIVMAPRAAVAAERITEVLDTEPSVRPPVRTADDDAPAVTPLTRHPTARSLELRDAEFRYPGADEPVVCDVSFRALAGQTTAVIGSTGAGKTTLLSLVSRLMDVTSGAVLIDGVDVRELPPDALHDHIGLVPQTPYLFSGTVASNLRHGKPDATEDELWHALEVAQARDFVAAMPGQLDAPIAQGGTNVSGGQRQRLAIARAVIRDPAIYLFDDAFSALDLSTDARLRAALRPLTADAVVVIVAQRVSTIRTADQIIVLEDGRVVGIGTHAELLATCPTYAEIVESQLSAEEAA